jgi:hypothetical protein
MAEDRKNEGRHERWKFDKTWNLPTIITILTVGVSAVAYVARVENKADNALQGVARLEAQQTAQGQSQSVQLQNLRAELRADLRDVNAKLDSLLLRLGTGMRNIDSSDWSR